MRDKWVELFLRGFKRAFLRIGCLEFGMVLGIGCMNPRLHSAYDVK